MPSGTWKACSHSENVEKFFIAKEGETWCKFRGGLPVWPSIGFREVHKMEKFNMVASPMATPGHEDALDLDICPS